MYDFCFTPFYAILLVLGGAYAYFVKGSVESLGSGVGAAAALSLCAYWSFLSFTKHKTCKPAVFIELVISASLAVFMYQRFVASRKIHTAIVGGLSALMAVFYLWNIFFGPTPKKLQKRS